MLKSKSLPPSRTVMRVTANRMWGTVLAMRARVSRIRGDGWWIVLSIAAFSLYGVTSTFDWTLDDFVVIVNNPDVTSFGAFFENAYPTRPLREISFLFDHALFGLNPGGWHVQSICWHVVCALLLRELILRTSVSVAAANLCALLYLIHPLHVEAVANLANRKESLTLAFSLASLLAYAHGCGAGCRRSRWFALAVLLAGVALLGKETAIVIPLIWILWEGTFLPEEERWLLADPRRLFIGLGGGLLGGVCWYAWFGGLKLHQSMMVPVMAKMNKSHAADSMESYFQMMLKGWSFIFSRIVWPVDLAPEYVYGAPTGWLDGWVLAALGVVALSVAILWWGARRGYGALVFGIGWFWLCWLPVANLWPIAYFAADRYCYAPLVGVAIVAAWAVDRSPLGWQMTRSLCAVVILSLAVLTWYQVAVWENQRTLWTQGVKVNPASTTALTNLGAVCIESGEYDRARELLERAAYNMNDPLPYFLLGRLYAKVGELDRALLYYKNFLAFGERRYARELSEAQRFIRGTRR